MLRVIHWGTDFCVNSRVGGWLRRLFVYLFESSKLKAERFFVHPNRHPETIISALTLDTFDGYDIRKPQREGVRLRSGRES